MVDQFRGKRCCGLRIETIFLGEVGELDASLIDLG
jgi:hypothetical protein